MQGLAPLTELRHSTYQLGGLPRIHCPFWLSCIDEPRPTEFHVSALVLYLHSFGFIAVTPPWLTDWIRRHDDLYRKYLENTT